jgi:transposase-like protein
VKDVVDTETLKRDSPFGFKRNIFSFPELDVINKAAYWDYQRERVYVKSNECLNKVLSRSPRRRKVLSPNQTIECSAPRSCPRCRSTRFYADGKKRKTVTDLKFMKHGIKRWVVLYHFHRYRCRKCGAVFLPEERYWTSSRYGPGIAAYSLYMNIGLRLSQRIVNHTINRLFGYHLAIGLTRRIKERAAHVYKETYESLVNRLCSAQLIHIDETKVSVGGKDGFV